MSKEPPRRTSLGYDENLVIPRPCYKFRCSTWESFRNPCLKNDDVLSQVLHQNVGVSIPIETLDFQPLLILLTKLRENLARKRWQKMVEYHYSNHNNVDVNICESRNNYANKKSLVNLFRAIGQQVLPRNLFGKNKDVSNLKQVLRNMNILLSLTFTSVEK